MGKNVKHTFQKKAFILFFILVALLGTLITASVAWFTNRLEATNDGFQGSAIVSYFAGGDGSKEDPYRIAEPRHLYNLAWLQNMTDFGGERKYFKVADANGNPITINMAGELSTDGVSGAIPPIGSINRPFKGEFDGNGSIIENLWVSTDPDDWKRLPQGLNTEFESSGEVDYVGLFGAIGETAIVHNFKLDKIEVKTDIDATVGIVCGYVDAMVFNVGVYNGIITATDGAVLKSNYSILGAKSSRIIWEDMPAVKPGFGEGGGEGGVIRVDVNDDLFTNLFTGNNISSDAVDISDALTDAMKDRSYLVGDVAKTTQSKAPVFYIYSTRINSSTGYTTVDGRLQKTIETNNAKGTITSPTADAFLLITESNYSTALNSPTNDIIKNNLTYNADFDTRIKNLTKSRILLTTGSPPSFDMTTSGWESNFVEVPVAGAGGTTEELYIPKNGVWFKPSAPGPSVVSFTVCDNSRDAHRSIYRYKRDENGKIIESSVTETVFVLNVDKKLHASSSCFGNGDIVSFEYMIDQTDVDEEYEFIIASSSDYPNEDSRSGFLFLALAGASNTGGPTTDGDGNPIFKETLYDVDYVVSLNDDMTAEDYQIHQSILRVAEYTAPAGGQISLYYLAKTVQNDPDGFASRVFYHSPDQGEITDITISEQSQYSSTQFSDRETVASSGS